MVNKHGNRKRFLKDTVQHNILLALASLEITEKQIITRFKIYQNKCSIEIEFKIEIVLY